MHTIYLIGITLYYRGAFLENNEHFFLNKFFYSGHPLRKL